MSSNFHPIGSVDDFKIGSAKRIVINDTAIAVYRLEDGFHATDDLCPHMKASLAYGKIDNHVVACPRHGAKFDIKTGHVLSLPSVHGVRSYAVKVEGNQILVSDKPIEEKTPEMLRFD